MSCIRRSFTRLAFTSRSASANCASTVAKRLANWDDASPPVDDVVTPDTRVPHLGHDDIVDDTDAGDTTDGDVAPRNEDNDNDNGVLVPLAWLDAGNDDAVVFLLVAVVAAPRAVGDRREVAVAVEDALVGVLLSSASKSSV
jgi:hypothetical protein